MPGPQVTSASTEPPHPTQPTHSIRRWAGRTPVWVRLVILALVPLVGMGLVVRPLRASAARTASEAARAQEAITEFGSLIDVRFAFEWEGPTEETIMRLATYGVSLDESEAVLGIDLRRRLADSRAEMDRALAAAPLVGEVPAVDALRNWLPSARREVDGSSIDPTLFESQRLALGTSLSDAMEQRFLTMTAGTDSALSVLPGWTLGTLTDVVDWARAGGDEIDLVAQTMIGPVDQFDSVRSQLVATQAMYVQAEDRLAAVARGPVRTGIENFRSNLDAANFDDLVSRITSSQTAPDRSDPPVMVPMFRAAFVRDDLLRELTYSARQQAFDVATANRNDALGQLHETEWFLALIVLTTALTAAIVAWTISRRLRHLALTASRLSHGDLRSWPMESGPREITVVVKALHEAVANLSQVERQAKALASGELGDEALTRPTAGRLGQSIQASVAQLSRAWSEREELRMRLSHQASHDLLTSLPNRAFLLEALDRTLARARTAGETVGVLFIDLDGFKRANDSYGHRVGDQVLQEVARRLRHGLRATDFLARLGGDEFVVVVEATRSIDDIVRLGEHLIRLVAQPVEIDGRIIQIGASVGVTTCTDTVESPTDLLRKADNAVYRAKRAGRGQLQVFDASSQRELDESAALEAALREAMRNDELTIEYQVVCDVETRSLRGFEALARWHHAVEGEIPPTTFIPVAERSALIVDLDCWMLRTATRQLADWTAAGLFADAYISVNISGRHLVVPTVVDDVVDALQGSGLEPSRLLLEITETVIVDDLAVAADRLAALRTMGVRVALDDFGTGYTSVGQLWQLPLDVLKIDRSFVDGLDSVDERTIVGMLISVGHSLGLELIAEGVEQPDQLSCLRQLSCDAAQGFLFARSQTAAQIEALAPGPFWNEPVDELAFMQLSGH